MSEGRLGETHLVDVESSEQARRKPWKIPSIALAGDDDEVYSPWSARGDGHKVETWRLTEVAWKVAVLRTLVPFFLRLVVR